MQLPEEDMSTLTFPTEHGPLSLPEQILHQPKMISFYLWPECAEKKSGMSIHKNQKAFQQIS